MTIHTVAEMLESLRKKETQPSDWAKQSFAQIAHLDEQIGAFITVNEENGMAQAKAINNHAAEAPFHGIPYALKDNMCTEGLRTTAASRILENYIPPYSSTVALKLKQAGGVMVGKTNMDEFAMGSTTETSAFKQTKNPYNLEFVPGGSSGGSAAAVAAGMVPFALGSDTGGSIRQPAAFCGVVGLKPTYGRVSRYGLIAFASSLDQIGPFTRTAKDAALVLEAISGHDERDSTSAPVAVERFSQGIEEGVKGLKVGILKDLSSAKGLDAKVKEAVEKAVQVLESAGAEIVEIELPHMKYAVSTYYLLAPAEASSNLSRYDGVRYGRRVEGESLLEMYEKSRSEGFGMEVKRRIMIGTYALSSGYYDAYYLRAQKMRTLIRRDFEAAFTSCDVVITPTTPTTAFRLGDKMDNPLQLYLNDIFTIPANLAGLPGVSVPCGMDGELPIGLQIIGKAFAEQTILRVAHAYENLRGFAIPLPELEGVR
jgi:aspartyl-tRNA(Asn)/glutamyl-tRNA(Gln) amidotransferase subunit A